VAGMVGFITLASGLKNAMGTVGEPLWWSSGGHRFFLLAGLQRLYPLVNQHSYGQSLFLMGKSTINGHFQ